MLGSLISNTYIDYISIRILTTRSEQNIPPSPIAFESSRVETIQTNSGRRYEKNTHFHVSATADVSGVVPK